jgi:hypothetical protein
MVGCRCRRSWAPGDLRCRRSWASGDLRCRRSWPTPCLAGDRPRLRSPTSVVRHALPNLPSRNLSRLVSRETDRPPCHLARCLAITWVGASRRDSTVPSPHTRAWHGNGGPTARARRVAGRAPLPPATSDPAPRATPDPHLPDTIRLAVPVAGTAESVVLSPVTPISRPEWRSPVGGRVAPEARPSAGNSCN